MHNEELSAPCCVRLVSTVNKVISKIGAVDDALVSMAKLGQSQTYGFWQCLLRCPLAKKSVFFTRVYAICAPVIAVLSK